MTTLRLSANFKHGPSPWPGKLTICHRDGGEYGLLSEMYQAVCDQCAGSGQLTLLTSRALCDICLGAGYYYVGAYE